MKKRYILAIIPLFLYGCGLTTYITPDQYKKAEDFCEPNDGIHYIITKASKYVVYCNNTAKFVIIIPYFADEKDNFLGEKNTWF